MKIREAILKLSNKWRVYDQCISEAKELLRNKNVYRSSQSIDREIRKMAELDMLESRKVKGKTYKQFRRKAANG